MNLSHAEGVCLTHVSRRIWAAGMTMGAVAAACCDVASAEDASFGCQVLLCAAASNPSWSAIAYCVPPMTRLFDDLAHSKPWPSCVDADQTGDVGYDPYYPCPNGGIPGEVQTGPQSHELTFQPSMSGSQCLKLNAPTGNSMPANPDGPQTFERQSIASRDVTTKREARPNPYYVVLREKGAAPFTFWFKLKPQ